MKEEAFRKLLSNYLKDNSSNEENQLIERFLDNSKKESLRKKNFNSTKKSTIKKDIWQAVRRETNVIVVTPNLAKQYGKYAAAASIILLLGYFLIKPFGVANDLLETNSITLELQDGSIQLLDIATQRNIFNSKGNLIGKQEGNSLIYQSISKGATLMYNTLTIPNGKTFSLTLSDGTLVELNSGSSLTYPTHFIYGKNRQVYIKGEAFLKVAKDSLHPFIVKADNLNIQVLGTEFNVMSHSEDATTEVVLVEGAVSLFSETDDKNLQDKVILTPGYKAVFNKKSRKIEKEEVLTDIYTSWLNGELVFRELPFENMLSRLERHYNVVIDNENKVLSKQKFDASFRNVPIITILENLKKYHNIDYVIEGNKITIK